MFPLSQRKLREAIFFLEKMRGTELSQHLSSEEFGFYLSAFLSAARSVTFTMQAEDSAVYQPARVAWGNSLNVEEKKFLKFMIEERNLVEKVGKASVTQSIEMISMSEFRSKRPPPRTSRSQIIRPFNRDQPEVGALQHHFEYDGADWPVADLCNRYIEMLSSFLKTASDPGPAP
ncbi:MAG: hypothetical protein ABJB74_07475 [Gemmatimonas sp.]